MAQANAVNAGQDITTQLNSMSAGIQTLRTNADTDIGSAVSTVNTLLGNIATYNNQFVRAQAKASRPRQSPTSATRRCCSSRSR